LAEHLFYSSDPADLVKAVGYAEMAEILEQNIPARLGSGSAEDETSAWAAILYSEAAVLVGHREATDLLLRS